MQFLYSGPNRKFTKEEEAQAQKQTDAFVALMKKGEKKKSYGTCKKHGKWISLFGECIRCRKENGEIKSIK